MTAADLFRELAQLQEAQAETMLDAARILRDLASDIESDDQESPETVQ